MRLPWSKPKADQLELLDADPDLPYSPSVLNAKQRAQSPTLSRSSKTAAHGEAANAGRPPLVPLDLARFIKTRVGAGESNAAVAKRLGMNETTLAHHVSLLELPPVLDQALKTGRCISPRTLHELSKLHESEPDRVRALLDSDAEVARLVVEQLKDKLPKKTRSKKPPVQADLIAQANAACDQLERALARIDTAAKGQTTAALLALHQRLTALASRCSPGV